ncbi:MAG: CDP-diacylglycerol--serine O-phosphatidyltransferase [Kiritimatiellae bacterium]|nr:CDP-diacylglycerol--serine O-phosphatidyltransferase [Kiritimatiellia bacterium]
MSWRRWAPNCLTVLALLSGVTAILMTLDGRFGLAAQLIMLAMILDGLDGNLARLFHVSSEFGGEMDTFVDITAFGLAPAILLYETVLPEHRIWRAAIALAVVLSGVFRLSRFKVQNVDHGQKGYTGLPITANAGWVAVLVFLNHSERFAGFSIGRGPGAAVFLTGVLLFTVLQVSNVRYPKPTKKAAAFAVCVVLVVLFLLPGVSVPAAYVMLLLGLGYVGIGPLLHKRVAPPAATGPAARQPTGA